MQTLRSTRQPNAFLHQARANFAAASRIRLLLQQLMINKKQLWQPGMTAAAAPSCAIVCTAQTNAPPANSL